MNLENTHEMKVDLMEEIGEVDHIAIAVRNIDRATRFFTEFLNFELQGDKVKMKEEGINYQFLKSNGWRVELLEPLDDSSIVSEFLKKRGEGFHHICFRVDDIEKALERIRSMGYRVVGENLHPEEYSNRYAFIHPKDCFGVLIELEEK